MSVDQRQFHDALWDNARDAPAGLRDGQGRPAGARFSVYRNNVAVGLTEALEVSFPAIVKLIGPENFKKVAGVFLRQHPPKSPLIMVYGTEFPVFLESFQPLNHIGYLPDVARLEQALRESYHAADATPIDPGNLANLSEEELTATRMTFAPSARLICSHWPVHAIWAYNLEDGAPKPANVAQDVFITRPDFDPQCHPLSKESGVFFASLLLGNSIGEAFEDAAETSSEFDLAAVLTLLLDTQAITAIHSEV
ncbi:DNA-binding domain-containing protein [Roseovarius sp. MMSF_3281]|uniref:HvfC/BufC N-terminal domain-containing protein n=1 Tax=Roseovarius sp. MMSF_3281 TaxID=3046694 RepID=UPI00273D33F6|nr:DNA-binding domain-containing protein [Roseovarius sp. MMSF_3281]